MFEVPGSDVKTVHITGDCVKGMCPPEYIKSPSPPTSTTTNGQDQPNQTSTSEEEESRKVRVKQ